MADVGVVIAGGGRGSRIGGTIPKQFLRLGGIPVLARTAAVFDGMSTVSSIVLVVPEDFVPRTRRLVARSGLRKVTRVVAGGRDRQDSVWKGLQAFPNKPSIVLVHDAVRMFIRPETVVRVISNVRKFGAAVVGVRVTDTTKVGSPDGFYESTLDRDSLWAVQTPQGFRFDLLDAAHRAARRNRFRGTDEASLVERLGIRVRIVEGEYGNTKITSREDLNLAKMRVNMRV